MKSEEEYIILEFINLSTNQNRYASLESLPPAYEDVSLNEESSTEDESRQGQTGRENRRSSRN